jgi:hypothetical protein
MLGYGVPDGAAGERTGVESWWLPDPLLLTHLHAVFSSTTMLHERVRLAIKWITPELAFCHPVPTISCVGKDN